MNATSCPARCGRCGREYARAAFGALAAVRTLGEAEVSPLVVAWPSDLVVDVRACAACATPIARLSRVAHAK